LFFTLLHQIAVQFNVYNHLNLQTTFTNIYLLPVGGGIVISGIGTATKKQD